MKKTYQRERVLKKLDQNGISPQFNKLNNAVDYFKVKDDRAIGIKMWGMIDFIGAPVVRV